MWYFQLLVEIKEQEEKNWDPPTSYLHSYLLLSVPSSVHVLVVRLKAGAGL